MINQAFSIIKGFNFSDCIALFVASFIVLGIDTAIALAKTNIKTDWEEGRKEERKKKEKYRIDDIE